MDFWEEPKAPEMKTILPILNGIFSSMSGYTFKAGINKQQLDTMFLASYGRRNPSPIVDLIAEKYDVELDDILPATAISELSQLMLGMYKPKWDKLGEVYDIEYDPIHNYLDEWEDTMDGEKSSTESVNKSNTETLNTTRATSNTKTYDMTEDTDESKTLSNTRTDNLTEGVNDSKTIANTRTDNLTELETRNLANSSQGSDSGNVYAFDSGASPVGKRTGSESGSGTDTGTITTANTGTQGLSGTETEQKTTTNTGTQSNSGSEGTDRSVDTTGTVSDSGSVRDTGTVQNVGTGSTQYSQDEGRERSGRHFGNIGNLTSQKQIQEEIDLWKWNYMRSILRDAADFLCIEMYLNY